MVGQVKDERLLKNKGAFRLLLQSDDRNIENAAYFEKQGVVSKGSKVVSYLKNESRPFQVYFDSKEEMNRALDSLNNINGYRYVEPNYPIYPMSDIIPSDPLYQSNQWYFNNDGSYHVDAVVGADMNMQKAWQLTTGSSDVVVAIIDSGIDLQQSEFAGRIWENQGEIAGNGIDDDNNGYIDDVNGYDFANKDSDPSDYFGHGSSVSSILAANGNDASKFAGVDWSCKIMPLKCLFDNGSSWMIDVIESIYYAVDNGADVINISLGGPDYSVGLGEAIAYAIANDVLVFASMGNANSEVTFYPAAYPNVFAIGASDYKDVRSSFSNFGSHNLMLAPGTSISRIITNTNLIAVGSATSYCTPLAAGVGTLMKALMPSLTVDSARAIFALSCRDMVGNSDDVQGWDQYYGYGVLDAYNALRYLSRTDTLLSVASCDSYFFNDKYEYTTGTYYDTLVAQDLSDSIITLSLKINSSETTPVKRYAVGSFSFGGVERMLSDSYTHTFQNQYGCDSIVNLDLLLTDHLWDGQSWLGGSPIVGEDALIQGDIIVSGELTMQNLLVLDGVHMEVNNEACITIHGDSENNGIMNIESGASLITYGDVAGDAFIVNRNTSFGSAVGRYSFVGSPIQSGRVDSLGTIVYEYDESEPYLSSGLNRYKPVLSPNLLLSGKGYASAYTGSLAFEGTPNFGDVQVGVSRTDDALDENEGFNIIANPYPCAISFELMVEANSALLESESIWIWDDFSSDTQRGTNDDFVVINEIGFVDSRSSGHAKWDGFVRSGQGFFIKASQSGSFMFTDHMKVLGANSDASYFRRVSDFGTLKIQIKADEHSSKTLLGFLEGATAGKDQRYDAINISDDRLRVYSMIEQQAYAIQGLPIDYLDPIQLGFEVLKAGEYKLSFQTALEEGLWQFLDSYTGSLYDLDEEIVFESDAGIYNDRFQLVNTRLTLFELEVENLLVVSVKDHLLMVQHAPNLVGERMSIELISLSGKRVLVDSYVVNSTESSVSLASVSHGIYMIQVSMGNERYTSKIILD